MADDVITGLVGALSALGGWLGGRRGRSASASRDEAEAARVQGEAWERLMASLERRIGALEGELGAAREELARCESLHAEARASISRLEAMVADLLGQLRAADLIDTGDLDAERVVRREDE
jgi:chromosome segregation ATPase